MKLKRNLTEIDCAILYLIRKAGGELLQADLVNRLLPVASESYLYSRIRTLEHRGFLERRQATAQRKTIFLTPKGHDVVTTVDSLDLMELIGGPENSKFVGDQENLGRPPNE